jgi:hypothetical protein
MEGKGFCHQCGRSVAGPAAEPAAVSPTASQPPVYPVAYPPQPVIKTARKKTGLIIGISAGVLVLILTVVGVSALLKSLRETTATTTTAATETSAATTRRETGVALIPFPDELSPKTDVNIACVYQAVDVIIPANYRSLDSVVKLQCWTDQGQADILISVEIPGLTQKYEQKLSVSRLETEVIIRPPLLPDVAKTLNSSRDGQLNIVVTDLDKNRIVVQDARPVKIYSRYDMQWQDSNGTPYYENILAWVTPEAEEIRTFLRLAAEACDELTEGELKSIVGYQPVADWYQEEITYVQVACMMHALAAKLNVTYIMAPFSSTSTDLQRIATPAQVINTAGGLCVETAVTLASAIQATNMHAVLLLLPGHMQVAVETWYDSGRYFLIETTALSAAAEQNFDLVIDYTMTQEDWEYYLIDSQVIVIDCDLAEQLQIKSID